MEEKIDVGFATAGLPRPAFVANMFEQVTDLAYAGMYGMVHMKQSSILMTSRNMVVESFLEGTSDWLWMVDDDMTFDKYHPLTLLDTAHKYDTKMVSGLAFMFLHGNQPVPSYFIQEDGEYKLIYNRLPKEVCIVAATGLATSLVHREVFERMEAPRTERYRWFDLLQLPDNEGLAGEDVQFFHRARELGYDLLLNPEAQSRHIKTISLGANDYERYWELKELTRDS